MSSPTSFARHAARAFVIPIVASFACRAPEAYAPRPAAERAPALRDDAKSVTPRGVEITPIPAGDPAKEEVSFAAREGWQGTLVLDNGGVGVWTVGVLKAFQPFGCPEIVALDDKGRCHVVWSYSGKWTPMSVVGDGTWLGGLVQADIDPRVPGSEIYVGAQGGSVYEIVAYPDKQLDYRRVTRLAGSEVHTLIGGEVDASSPGPELIAFTLPGAVWRLTPRAPERDGFDAQRLVEIEGRVRDAQELPRRPGALPEFATVMRSGEVAILSFTERGPVFTPVLKRPMGMGRVAIRRDAPPERPVIYSTADDGCVFRSERGADGAWTNELIYAGPQGMRGCAWGRFDADPTVETIVVHGYSHEVELLSKRADGWTARTLFVDRDKGHWVTSGELDGRNATDEIVCAGYSGRVVSLARPPGYGLGSVLSVAPVR